MRIYFKNIIDLNSWKFIFETEYYFSFGKSNTKQIFYTKPFFCFIQSGILSQNDQPEKGYREGNTMSRYLFILCAKNFGILIEIMRISRAQI